MGDVGGNSLGFYGCAFSPCGNKVIAHSYQGAFQMWKKDSDDVSILTKHFFKIWFLKEFSLIY